MGIYDVVVLGAGPAGLAAGLSAKMMGAETVIIERDNRPGGILKQCIHDGFGIIRFNERLSGPEYAERYIKMVKDRNIPVWNSTFVQNIRKRDENFLISLINSKEGIFDIESKTIVMANGCRERTAKQVLIQGKRPSGVLTAGTAQYFVNIMGYIPCRKCVILGSGDIGLIMARRLTLEGSEVLGVYEVKPEPSGLSRNIAQCLEDYSIPLYLSHTITRIFGDDRVEGVEISKVDERMNPIPGTEERVECDGVILSVGLIPENEIAESLNIGIDNLTKGPYVDQNLMTLKEGIFSCGNALHVNDLVDYVSESGELAGRRAAVYANHKAERILIPINISRNQFSYAVPQYFDAKSDNKELTLYFRSKKIMNNVSVNIYHDESIRYFQNYKQLKPPEMGRMKADLSDLNFNCVDTIDIDLLEE